MVSEDGKRFGKYTKEQWIRMIKDGVVSDVSDPVLEFVGMSKNEYKVITKKEEFIKGDKQKESEARIQANAFMWFNNTFPHLRGLLYHVPNGEKRDPITANKLKAMGVVPGVPDIVFHFRQRTYFFEFKKPGGTTSEDQNNVIAQLDLMRFMVWVVDSLEQFQELINAILNDTSQQFTLGITKEDFNYRHKIFTYLYDLSFDSNPTIESLTSPETRNKFIYYVQEFITEAYDRLDNFELRFSSDYKTLIKKKYEPKESDSSIF